MPNYAFSKVQKYCATVAAKVFLVGGSTGKQKKQYTMRCPWQIKAKFIKVAPPPQG
jgi:hypothetical protein